MTEQTDATCRCGHKKVVHTPKRSEQGFIVGEQCEYGCICGKYEEPPTVYWPRKKEKEEKPATAKKAAKGGK
ncbi:MAG: hypothetical protein ACK4S4_15510 [Pyrinomonadaceae bacterium]